MIRLIPMDPQTMLTLCRSGLQTMLYQSGEQYGTILALHPEILMVSVWFAAD